MLLDWLFGNNVTPDNGNKKKDTKDQGVYGIDWDGDGKVSETDDLMTMDFFTDD